MAQLTEWVMLLSALIALATEILRLLNNRQRKG